MRLSFSPLATALIWVAMVIPTDAAATTAPGMACNSTGTLTFSPAMQILGGSGNWTGSGNLACATLNGPFIAAWTGSGSYSSTACGTFSMSWSGGNHIDVQGWAGIISHGSSPVGSAEFVPSGSTPTVCATSAAMVAHWYS